MNQNNELVQIVIGVLIFAFVIWLVMPSEPIHNYDYPGQCLEKDC